jgi:hypothetical protein
MMMHGLANFKKKKVPRHCDIFEQTSVTLAEGHKEVLPF